MDLLGKQGEEAKDEVEEVSQELRSLQSHLDAVDTALQDFMEKSHHLMEKDLEVQQKEVEELGRFEQHERRQERLDQGRMEENEKDIEFIKNELLDIKKRQIEQEKKIQQITDSELLDVIEKVRGLINKTNKRFYDLQDSVQHLENRLNELENDFVMEVNTRDFDFERKVDQSEFDTKLSEVENSLKKVRSSLSILAEDEDGHSKVWKKLN